MRALRSRRVRTAVAVGVIAMLLAVITVVQVRSQLEVERSLAGQDNTSLAFVIDDLHRANEALAGESTDLSAQKGALQQGGDPAASAALADELARLRVASGVTPVHGPGVVLALEAQLTPLDLQDAINNLRSAGAEAIAINDHRVVSQTVIRTGPGGAGVLIDEVGVSSPWTLAAIGDPIQLPAMAQTMTQSLRSDRRVARASYRADPDLQIRATASLRPLVYGNP